jgi:hypothetical protein
MSRPDNIITETVTVGAGTSLSGASTKHPGYILSGVMTASTWDAAKIAFQVSVDGTTYAVLKPAGTEYEFYPLELYKSSIGYFDCRNQPSRRNDRHFSFYRFLITLRDGEKRNIRDGYHSNKWYDSRNTSPRE